MFLVSYLAVLVVPAELTGAVRGLCTAAAAAAAVTPAPWVEVADG